MDRAVGEIETIIPCRVLHLIREIFDVRMQSIMRARLGQPNMQANALYVLSQIFITVPFAASVLTGTVALVVAFVAFVARAIAFLKSGAWMNSACEVTADLALKGFNLPNACHEFSFEWIGVNIILRWALIGTDVSVSALIVGLALIASGLIWLFSIALVVRSIS